MGGVGVVFEAESREVVVEFYNSGAAHALFADNVTEDMQTQPVADYGTFLEKVRHYLYERHAPARSREPELS